MALLDRFRTHPVTRIPTPPSGWQFVQELPLDERELLNEVAREDADPRVRRAAVAKLMDPRGARRRGERRRRRARARAGAVDAARHRARGVRRRWAKRRASRRSTRSTTPKTLVGDREERVARGDGAARAGAGHRRPRARLDRAPCRARERCGARAFDGAARSRARCSAVALNSEFKDPTLAAVERITDRAELEQIAARAKNKSASKRARAIVREMDERAGRRRTGRA